MATGSHTISHAKTLRWSNARHPGADNGLRGIPFVPIVRTRITAPAAADADALVTKQVFPTAGATFTFATAVSGLTTNSDSGRTLGTPRNITITTSDLDGGFTLIVKGYDTYGEPMTERISATTSDTTVSGKKAFSKVNQIYSETAGSSGTFYVGFGNRLGLPYKLEDVHDLVQIVAGTEILTSDINASDFVLPTYTSTETHSATVAVTGFAGLPRDVRGTWKPSAAPDGTRNFTLYHRINDPDSKFGAYGLDQAT